MEVGIVEKGNIYVIKNLISVARVSGKRSCFREEVVFQLKDEDDEERVAK